jgi:prevent-host-death family protein
MNEVRIADLKAHLSEHLRGVRRGRSLAVLDRNTPIARIVPYSNDAGKLSIYHPQRDPAKLREIPLPPPLKGDVDIVSLLLDERQGER